MTLRHRIGDKPPGIEEVLSRIREAAISGSDDRNRDFPSRPMF
jgi:hypothetical protein